MAGPSRRLRVGAAGAGPLRLLLAVAILGSAGCGESGKDQPDSPRPLGEARDLPGAAVATPREQAREIAANPRLLLFDLQTALESVRETRGAYPSEDEFEAAGAWDLQRAALDAAFDSWSYESDGATYRLTGQAAGREFGTRSPE